MSQSQPRFAKDFWRHYSQQIVLLIVVTQFISVAIVVGLFYATGFFEHNLMASVSIVVALGVLATALSILIYTSVARPLKDMLAAVIHVSGEPTSTPPPNPNNSRFEKSGFKDVLQTIYQLAGDSDKKTTVTDSSDVISALNQTLCGFIIMNRDGVVSFSNTAAPVNVDTNGKQTLSLIFNGNDTLESWLKECEESAVHAEKTWTRIANKLPDEEDRRLFDVHASYSKGTENEVILAVVDQTSEYITSEQDLDFIAFAAHELRGPITVIRGYLDVLQSELDDTLAEDQVELFHRLTISANRISGYINNILNTSRYDRRHLKMHLIETSAASIYDMISDDMGMRASAQGRLLSVHIPKDLPTIAADPNSLSEVFGNLVDNAIKYSNEGSAIDVSATVKGDFVEIAVEDHGIGMPGNVVSNLFQKFYRSHRSRESIAGSGIGLYISKAIVESHGGTIGVRSEEGKGSTFTVNIPTYRSVADKLQSNNSNEAFIDTSKDFITNHSMYRG
jgi:signal transduction histidine kinase